MESLTILTPPSTNLSGIQLSVRTAFCFMPSGSVAEKLVLVDPFR